VRGGKLVGSAQRHTARAYLQQGSVLLGEGHLRLVEYLALADVDRGRIREDLRRAAGSADRWLGREAPLERFADALHAELRPRSDRVEGASGAFLLTLRASGFYTPAGV